MKKINILGIAMMSILYFSCENNEQLDQSLLNHNPDDFVQFNEPVKNLDVVNIDTVISSNLSYSLLGAVSNDLGKMNSSLVTQFRLSTANPSFGDDPFIDSVTLNLPFLGQCVSRSVNDTTIVFDLKLDSIYGNTENALSVKVLELAERLNTVQETYYSNAEVSTAATLFEGDLKLPSICGDTIYNNSAATAPNPTIVVNLDNEDYFLQKILKYDGENVLQNNAEFLNHFYGIEVVPTNEDSHFVKNVNTSNFINIFYGYTDTDGAEQHGSYALTTGSTATRFFTIESDKTSLGTEEQAMLDNQTGSLDQVYVQGGEGTAIRFNLFTQEIYDEMVANEWKIISARLHVPVSEKSDVDFPRELSVFNQTDNTTLVDNINNNVNGLGGEYDEDSNSFIFDITNQVNAMSRAEQTNKLFELNVGFRGYTPEHIYLGGNQNITEGIYLEINYLK